MSDKEIQEYLKGKNPSATPLFMAFRSAVLSAGEEVSEKVSRTMVAWKAQRTFATAYLKGKYLECSIDLLRNVHHQHLKASFHTTKKVITHRFTLEPGESIDEEMQVWLREAIGTVGPGFRKS